MNLEVIKQGLLGYDKKEVGVYLSYLKEAKAAKKSDGTPKNWWFSKVSDQELVAMYKRVNLGGVFIDGETVTLNYISGVLVPNYGYQAYKNRVLHIYPETTFDLQNVNKGDTFAFSKKSGRVEYEHNLKNPFDPSPEIIGVYCIIKNKRGEFLEILNNTDLKKMRSKAKSDNVWMEWYNQMTLKSAIKRGCKRHFNDITAEMDKIDNENYDLDLGEIAPPESIFTTIDSYTDPKELIAWAASMENAPYHNDQAFRKAVDDKNKELSKTGNDGE